MLRSSSHRDFALAVPSAQALFPQIVVRLTSPLLSDLCSTVMLSVGPPWPPSTKSPHTFLSPLLPHFSLWCLSPSDLPWICLSVIHHGSSLMTSGTWSFFCFLLYQAYNSIWHMIGAQEIFVEWMHGCGCGGEVLWLTACSRRITWLKQGMEQVLQRRWEPQCWQGYWENHWELGATQNCACVLVVWHFHTLFLYSLQHSTELDIIIPIL